MIKIMLWVSLLYHFLILGGRSLPKKLLHINKNDRLVDLYYLVRPKE